MQQHRTALAGSTSVNSARGAPLSGRSVVIEFVGVEPDGLRVVPSLPGDAGIAEDSPAPPLTLSSADPAEAAPGPYPARLRSRSMVSVSGNPPAGSIGGHALSPRPPPIPPGITLELDTDEDDTIMDGNTTIRRHAAASRPSISAAAASPANAYRRRSTAYYGGDAASGSAGMIPALSPAATVAIRRRASRMPAAPAPLLDASFVAPAGLRPQLASPAVTSARPPTTSTAAAAAAAVLAGRSVTMPAALLGGSFALNAAEVAQALGQHQDEAAARVRLLGRRTPRHR
jgi:hypothetical protein